MKTANFRKIRQDTRHNVTDETTNHEFSIISHVTEGADIANWSVNNDKVRPLTHTTALLNRADLDFVYCAAHDEKFRLSGALVDSN